MGGAVERMRRAGYGPLEQRRGVKHKQHRQHGTGDVGAERANEFQGVGGVDARAGQDPGRMDIARGDGGEHQRRDPPRHERQAQAEGEDQQRQGRRIFDAVAVSADRLAQRTFGIALLLVLGVHHRAADARHVEPEDEDQKAQQADGQKRIGHGSFPLWLASDLAAFRKRNKRRASSPRPHQAEGRPRRALVRSASGESERAHSSPPAREGAQTENSMGRGQRGWSPFEQPDAGPGRRRGLA